MASSATETRAPGPRFRLGSRQSENYQTGIWGVSVSTESDDSGRMVGNPEVMTLHANFRIARDSGAIP